MAATSRELVCQTLAHAGPARAPRDLWTLPIANAAYPEELRALWGDFPPDLAGVSGHCRERAVTRGDQYGVGEFTDEWGATFHNIQAGVIGEVKDPLVKDWATDRARIHIPREHLTIDRDAVNRDCAGTDRFTLTPCVPRPFEQLQFLRGSENLFVDLMDPPPGLLAFVRELHAFYTEWCQCWAATDVDALMMMDDWGAQHALLIAPRLWREVFKPLYRDYVQIAHGAGKKLFMHSDGYIVDIYPDLVELGVDAVNSQLFCMGPENLRQFAGKITFWGELDRQHLLPHGTPADIEAAVTRVYQNLWVRGGCIAQCELGAGAKPANARQMFDTWQRLTGQE